MPVTIRSKQDGFRRCGIAHSKDLVEYKDGHFSDEELEILQDDPMLIVEVIGGGASGTKAVNAKDAIDMIKGAGSVEVLEAMVSEDEDRYTVIAAVEARRAELEAGE
jgi:hypothetical protein